MGITQRPINPAFEVLEKIEPEAPSEENEKILNLSQQLILKRLIEIFEKKRLNKLRIIWLLQAIKDKLKFVQRNWRKEENTESDSS